MKRDMDLVRQMLLALEGDKLADAQSKASYEYATIAYHAALLIDAGLVEGMTTKDAEGMPARYFLQRMTWDGHDFLDSMRDDTVWRKARENIFKPIGGVAFDVLKEWLKAEMRHKLGLPVGE
jgi:hypothetical protein